MDDFLKDKKENFYFKLDSTKVGNIFTENDPITFNLVFDNFSDNNYDLEILYDVFDDEKRITSGKLDFKVESKKTNNKVLQIFLEYKGCFILKTNILSKDKSVRIQKETVFSRISSPSENSRNKDLFGVCTHFAQKKGDVETILELARLAGAGWIRDEMYWSSAEHKKGEIEILSEWDEWIVKAIEKKLKPLVILDYGNQFYDGGDAPYTEEAFEAFTKYAVTVVKHFIGKIDHFEIWNEWNIGYGNAKGQSPEVYSELLKKVYPAIKKANPNAFVIGGVTARVDLEWIKRILEKGSYNYFDAFSIHPYCYPASPEEGHFLQNLELILNIIDQYGESKPVWISEIGWPTHEGELGISENIAASYLVQTYVLNLSSKSPSPIFWYDLQNDGVNKQEKEDNFGLLRCWTNEAIPYAAKKNYIAYNVMANKLANVENVPIKQNYSNLRIYKFHDVDFDNNIFVLWSLNGKQKVRLKTKEKFLKLTDILGNEKCLKVTDGIIDVISEEIPFYIEGIIDDMQII